MKIKRAILIMAITAAICVLFAIVFMIVRLLPYWAVAVPLAVLFAYASIQWIKHVESYEDKRNNNDTNNQQHQL